MHVLSKSLTIMDQTGRKESQGEFREQTLMKKFNFLEKETIIITPERYNFISIVNSNSE